MSDDEAAEVTEIRADIDETQAEMSGTLRRARRTASSLRHLVNEAKEKVRDATVGRVEDTAKGVSDMVIETIKRNPIPAAMAGAGLALLWANRSNGSTPSRRRAPTGSDTPPGAFGSPRRAARAVGDRARGQPLRRASATASAAPPTRSADGARGDRCGTTHRRRPPARSAGQLESLMQASPLAMGAIAVGAGAVVGALIPETPQEREFLGDAGQQIGDTRPTDRRQGAPAQPSRRSIGPRRTSRPARPA